MENKSTSFQLPTTLKLGNTVTTDKPRIIENFNKHFATAGQVFLLATPTQANGMTVVTMLPSLSAVGSWEEVLLFSMDFTVSLNVLELELQDANFCLKKLAFTFQTACIGS